MVSSGNVQRAGSTAGARESRLRAARALIPDDSRDVHARQRLIAVLCLNTELTNSEIALLLRVADSTVSNDLNAAPIPAEVRKARSQSRGARIGSSLTRWGTRTGIEERRSQIAQWLSDDVPEDEMVERVTSQPFERGRSKASHQASPRDLSSEELGPYRARKTTALPDLEWSVSEAGGRGSLAEKKTGGRVSCLDRCFVDSNVRDLC